MTHDLTEWLHNPMPGCERTWRGQIAARELLLDPSFEVNVERGVVQFWYKSILTGQDRRRYVNDKDGQGYVEVAYKSRILNRLVSLKRGRIIWLASNPGLWIPDDHVIAHLDGRRTNDRATNLAAMPMREWSRLSAQLWWTPERRAAQAERARAAHSRGAEPERARPDRPQKV